jgi:1-aminocyclopropane-1-carboxylate deaminase/D-cysteine desulfhydrase-like pyridoxal-dependent ACC family enzyme
MPSVSPALFDAHPALAARLPRSALADLPTPVARLAGVDAVAPGASLYIKRDDLCSPVFGGNKTRKLELILGALERDGRDRAMTFGFAGSNHVAATALFCRRAGVRLTAFLMPQPMSAAERLSLLAARAAGAELRLYRGFARLVAGAAAYRMARPGRGGRLIPMIAAGGSSPEGNAAYVSAAFELKAQIDDGQLPLPDEIHVAAGSLGTASGLAVGLAAAGLPSRVIAIRAVEPRFADEAVLERIAHKTARFLHGLDPTFPRDVDLAARLDGGGFGTGYALPTPESGAAARLLLDAEGIRLDATYTAKAFARLLDAAREPRSRGRTLLFWHTGNAVDLTAQAAGVDWRGLPKAFHGLFET